jgi:tRNA pseudouridine13 synthase
MSTEVPKLEHSLGISVYASKAEGIGGRIRASPDDFAVEEILVDGSKASVRPEHARALASGHGRYLVCVLIKKGWDTFAAVRAIARQVGVSNSRISIAGIKDARALTAQHISIGGVPPQKALAVNLKSMTLIPVWFSSEKVSVRVLFGNQFDITVRSISCGSSKAHERIGKVKEEVEELGGFPNFFGHQRFGTVRPITHTVGRFLIQGNFEDAAHVFLAEPSAFEHRKARNAREKLRETQNYKDCLKLFPRRLVYERLILRHLGNYPNDFLGAFRRLSRSIRVLFVQAYQSYLFNRFLSERMNQGLPINKACAGDYVMALNEKGLPVSGAKKAELGEIAQINKAIRLRQMTIAIPLVGYDQLTSDGSQGQIEADVLEQEKVSSEDFRCEGMPEVAVAGGLRPVITPLFDLDIHDMNEGNEGNSLSVRFGFTLRKGSYATVVLREFMKPKDLIKAGF